MLHAIVKSSCVRLNSLLCFPTNDSRAQELKRRLAVVFLFDDPELGRHDPGSIITLRDLIDRLEEDDFVVTPRTDFAELQADIILLDIAVDDGSFAPSDDRDSEKQFNAEIDELADKLREIWRKINDAGMKLSRTEAKGVIEWVQQRLSHSVRTRKKVKKSVFDIGRKQENPFLPRQQDYMKKFLRKGNPPAGARR